MTWPTALREKKLVSLALLVAILGLVIKQASAERSGGGRRLKGKGMGKGRGKRRSSNAGSKPGGKSKKKASKSGSSKFMSVRRDFRKCVSPMCGGYWVKTVNEKFTRCFDGSHEEECYAAELDLEEIGGADSAGFFSSGTHLVVGHLVAKKFNRGEWTFGVLIVEEAWYGRGDGFRHPGPDWSSVQDNGMRCVTDPCFFIDQEMLNTGDTMTISRLDLSGVEASKEDKEEAEAALERHGLHVAGENAEYKGQAGRGEVLMATQFYLSRHIQGSK